VFGIHGWEWIILLVIILLIFGPAKIPDLARSLGKSIAEFRKGLKEGQEESTKGSQDSDEPRS